MGLVYRDAVCHWEMLGFVLRSRVYFQVFWYRGTCLNVLIQFELGRFTVPPVGLPKGSMDHSAGAFQNHERFYLLLQKGFGSCTPKRKLISIAIGRFPNFQRPSRSMLRKVSGIGAVLAHVCQLLVPKVVDLEVIWM